MAVNALLKFTQNASTPGAGIAMKGATGLTVTVENINTTDIASWQIDLVYTPPGSAVSVATPLAFSDNGNSPSTTFTPDVTGSYRFVLKLWNAINRSGTPQDTDIRVFSVPEANGLVVPPAQDFPEPLPSPASGLPGNKPNETNFGGQAHGWSGSGTDGLLANLIKRVDAITNTVAGAVLATALILSGANPATSGYIRAPHASNVVTGRNNANTQNVPLVRWGNPSPLAGTDLLYLGTVAGDAGKVLNMTCGVHTGGAFQWEVNGVAVANLNTAALTLGATSLTLSTGIIQLGLTPATSSGVLRLSNAQQIAWRNAGNSANIIGLQITSGNVVTLGDPAATNSGVELHVGGANNLDVKHANVFTYRFAPTNATFFSTNLTFDTGVIFFGTNPATTGTIRFANNLTGIVSRNAANNADVTMLSCLSDNAVRLGNVTNAAAVYILSAGGVGVEMPTGGTMTFTINAVIEYTISATAINMNGNHLQEVGDFDHNGTNLGLFGTAPTTKQTVSGSKGGNAALGDLITKLENYGLINDSTS